jgi:hypothetical protein
MSVLAVFYEEELGLKKRVTMVLRDSPSFLGQANPKGTFTFNSLLNLMFAFGF